MNLTLYNYAGETNKIDKELTDAVTITGGTLRNPSDVINPTVLIHANPIGKNYAEIPAFGRYYYITDVQAVRNGLYAISLKCDPLKSFADEIKALPCFLIRTQDNAAHEPFINDVNAQYSACDWVMTYRPYEFSEGAFKILVTAG